MSYVVVSRDGRVLLQITCSYSDSLGGNKDARFRKVVDGASARISSSGPCHPSHSETNCRKPEKVHNLEQTKAHTLSSRTQEDIRGTEITMGEVETRDKKSGVICRRAFVRCFFRPHCAGTLDSGRIAFDPRMQKAAIRGYYQI